MTESLTETVTLVGEKRRVPLKPTNTFVVAPKPDCAEATQSENAAATATVMFFIVNFIILRC